MNGINGIVMQLNSLLLLQWVNDCSDLCFSWNWPAVWKCGLR